MGYKRAKTVRLTWADGEFEGLEVRARRVSIAKFLELSPLLEDLGQLGAGDVAEMRGLFLEVGKLLVSWNVEDEDTGEPVPCTPEAFLEQDLGFVTAIITAWAEHIAGVPAPLVEPSPSGGPSLEASLPMEPLLESLPS